MRKVTFGGANSLDNFIARKNDEVDWLIWDPEVAAIFKEFWKTIDTVVMGRRTYETALRSGQDGYAGVKTYVFSRTLKKASTKQVEIISEEATSFLDRLKRETGKAICVMGGGVLARSLFAADLIDEVGVNVHPILLGSGIPLFHEMKQQINLELLEAKRLHNGCVVLRYRVLHESIKKMKDEGTFTTS